MAVFAASTAGLLLSFAVTALLRPVQPVPWRWAWQGMTLHAGLWLMMHTMLVVMLGRPWFAMATSLSFLMLLVQVSNAKYYSLREIFVFQDFEYFTDAIRHPRLYIPFLGWWKLAMIVVVVLTALSIGLWLEVAPEGRFALDGQLGDALVVLVAGVVLVAISAGGYEAVFRPDEDMRRLGILGSLWRYGWAEQLPIKLPNLLHEAVSRSGERPDLVVVQSESFFDPRPLFSSIRPEVLAEFDRIKAESVRHGRLTVPAWGANTVRSEFAFLSGVSEAMLGVHRFNPYRQILKAEVVTLAKVLRAAGYRTICVHPYPASFYNRERVYPHLGFDEFIDIRAFKGAERSGPYISDKAVGEKVKSLMNSLDTPVFVFVITMENHGPLHLEKPLPGESAAFYTDNPPPDCADLTVYLRHLRNADRMIGDLRLFLEDRDRPARLCWYGDHVPIMTDVYRQLGDPSGQTEYFIWSNQPTARGQASAQTLQQLAQCFLDSFLAPPGGIEPPIRP